MYIYIYMGGTQPMRLAAPMQHLCNAFGSFFKEWNGHCGKHAKLLWCPTAGTVTLGVITPHSNEAQVVVSSVQACILLLFHEQHRFSFKQIVDALELPVAVSQLFYPSYFNQFKVHAYFGMFRNRIYLGNFVV
jgi:hypothetical protein